MKQHLFLAIFLCFLSFQIVGQEIIPEDTPTEKINKHGLRASYLFNNHPFGIDQKSLSDNDFYTSGFEASYIRAINKNLNVLVPINIGSNNYPESNSQAIQKTTGYAGLDILGQYLITDRNYTFSPFVFAGLGTEITNFSSIGNLRNYLPFGVGLDYNFNPGASIGVKGGYRLGLATDDYLQLGAGLTIMLGNAGAKPKEVAVELSDIDGDGINDNEDECPGVAGTYAFNGCPDSDGDGVPDKDDKCPTVYGKVELDGCGMLDSDSDGVADDEDECPNESGTLLSGGCPDSDGDGIADKKDMCPDAIGTIQTNGCPDSDNDGFPDNDDQCPDVVGNVRGCPDADLDGISDDKDRCPNVGGVAENGGCPPSNVTTTTTTTSTSTPTGSEKVRIEEVFGRAKGLVEFETASARLKSRSLPILDEIVSILNQYPGQSMKIEGHTDSIGESGPNQRLSERRAKACYDYLIKKGISSKRLSYKGFGEKKPIATNKYKDGRKKNRRVEFKLWQQ